MIVRTYEEDDFRVHTLPLIAMGGVVLITLALVISVKLGLFERQAVPEQNRIESGVQVAETRSIRFHDGADGTIWVADAVSGEELGRYSQNEGGFVRATARAMVLTRQQNNLGPAVPFELIVWDNGGMTLSDPQTGRKLELTSFGTRTHEIYQDIMAKGRK